VTRNQMRLNQQLPDVSLLEDGVIMALWGQGIDTVAIARHLGRPEFQIYNRLWDLAKTRWLA
jgi:hypothetical protein